MKKIISEFFGLPLILAGAAAIGAESGSVTSGSVTNNECVLKGEIIDADTAN